MTATKQASASRGAIVGDFDPPVWDDYQLLPSARTIGANQPTYAAFGTSLYAWRMAAGSEIYSDADQFPHQWDLSPYRPHVHFSSDNGGTGNIVFEQVSRTRARDGAWSAELTRTATWTGTLAPFAGGALNLWTGDGDAPSVVGTSMLFKARLRLVSKTFAGNIFLDGWDIHIRKNRSGTQTELS